MAIDFNTVYEDMVKAAASSLKKSSVKISGQVQKIFERHKDNVKELTDMLTAGDLDSEEFKSEIEDNLDTLRAELLAAKVMGKAASQKAINAATSVLFGALKIV